MTRKRYFGEDVSSEDISKPNGIAGLDSTGKVPAAQLPLGSAASQDDSTASDVAGLRDDLNALLAKLRVAGLMDPTTTAAPTTTTTAAPTTTTTAAPTTTTAAPTTTTSGG